MSTTVRLDDDLYREVEAQAALEGRTVREVIEDALRLRRQHRQVDASVEPLPVYGGSGVMSGVDLGDTSALRDVDEAGPNAGASERTRSDEV